MGLWLKLFWIQETKKVLNQAFYRILLGNLDIYDIATQYSIPQKSDLD